MVEFVIRLAGVSIGLSVQYETTKNFCRNYLTDANPDFSISVSPEDIEAEKLLSEEYRKSDEGEVGQFSDKYLETLAAYRKIAEGLIDYDVLLFHGSALSYDGRGYLFTAPSGTGKSTHTRLWREVYGEHVVMINDDKPLIRVTAEGAFVCGTPWDGKHRLSTNTEAELCAVCMLSRDKENHIEKAELRDVWSQMYIQAYKSENPDKMKRILCLIDRIADKARLYTLGCNMEREAATVAFNALCGLEK